MMAAYSGTDNLEIMAEAVNYNRFLLELVRAGARPRDRILDFGAGIGTFARALTADGFDVLCVEQDDAQAATIREAGMAVFGSLDEVPGSSIDYLYSLNVLEHIADDLGALRECHARLKPGGRLLIYVPAFPMLFSSMDRKVGHCRRYTRGGLLAKVREAGFVSPTARYADCAGFLATLLYKLGGSDTGSIDRRGLVLYDRLVFPLSRAGDRILGRIVGKNVVLTATRA